MHAEISVLTEGSMGCKDGVQLRGPWRAKMVFN